MRKNFNGKIIGKDVMELSDIQALTPDDMKKYRIAVMQMELKGYEIEFTETSDNTWYSIINITWNWMNYTYRVVPKVELTPEQKLQNWIKETGAKVGDKVKVKDGDEGTIDDIYNSVIWVGFWGAVHACNPDELELVKPTYAELQAQWVKENNVKVGNTVKVLRDFKSGEFGDHVHWYDMNKYSVGETLKIFRIPTDCIIIQDADNDELGFPFQVLELVKPAIVPYTFEDFCTMEMQGKGVKRISDGAFGYICTYDEVNDTIRVNLKREYYGRSFDQFKDEFVWLNGEPCGVKL